LMARINFHGAYEIDASRHSSPTTATFIRAPVEVENLRCHRRPGGRTSPTAARSCHSIAITVRRNPRPTANRSPTGSVSLVELISTTPQSLRQQYGSRCPAAAVGDSDPAIRRQLGNRRPVADDGKARVLDQPPMPSEA